MLGLAKSTPAGMPASWRHTFSTALPTPLGCGNAHRDILCSNTLPFSCKLGVKAYNELHTVNSKYLYAIALNLHFSYQHILQVSRVNNKKTA